MFKYVIWKVAAILPWPQCVDSSKPGDDSLHQWLGSSLIQVMACCLCCTRPLPGPMLIHCQLDPKEQASVKLELKHDNSQWRMHFKKLCEKCPPLCKQHFRIEFVVFWFEFHWRLFLRVQLTSNQNWVRYSGLGLNRQQAIIWTNDCLVYWCILYHSALLNYHSQGPVSLTVFRRHFKFDRNFASLWFNYWSPDPNNLLHKPLQHSYRAMRKNFVALTLLEWRQEQNTFFIKFELRWKNVSEMGLKEADKSGGI